VHHVHTVLGACLNATVRKGLLVVSPASKAEVPVPGDSEAGRVLDQDQLTALMTGFRGSALYPIVAVAAFTGARRNEILALRWSDFDAGAKTLTIARSLEEMKVHGRRFKEPKTRRGRRTIAIDGGLAGLLSAECEKYLRLIAQRLRTRRSGRGSRTSRGACSRLVCPLSAAPIASAAVSQFSLRAT